MHRGCTHVHSEIGNSALIMTSTYGNPYESMGTSWLRGNLHCHTSEHSGCASVPLRDGVAKYVQAGYDFLAITDHNHLTDLAEVRQEAGDMLLLGGFEHSTTQHTLFVGEQVKRLYRRRLGAAIHRAGDLVTVIAHPAPWSDRAYTGHGVLDTVGGVPVGMEIHNGHYGIPSALAKGKSPRYTHIWDELLSEGIRLWGFCSDDFHDPEDFANAFLMVQAEDRSVRALLHALRLGRFYGSTGLLARTIEGSGGSLAVQTATESRGCFVGPGGEILSAETGTHFAFGATDELYVRFEAEGESGSLFTQPLFRETPSHTP